MSAPHPDRLSTGKIVPIRNGERRQVQFLVERTPSGYEHPSFPLPMWIYWPAEQRTDFDCAKCKADPDPKVYRIVEDKILLFYKMANIQPPPKLGPKYYVCEHQGHLIE